MPSPIHHPVFGHLVPDQWDRGLLTFRQFPHMKQFWHADPAGTISRLSAEEREWVTHWDRHAARLARVCRNFDVLAGLQSLGVYEVSVGVRKDGAPSAEQAATYQMFLDREEAVCRNVIDALLRYYRHARQALPDWFRDEDYPEGKTAEELSGLLRFDGIGIRRRPVNGICPITLGWDPDWDPEHGLVMAVYRDQVLEFGSSGELMVLEDPQEYLANPYLVWGPDQMNDAERAALREFINGGRPGQGVA
jgi:hypothetical protein